MICHHAHVPDAYEIYQEKLIVYSLGNLIFDHHKPPLAWNIGYTIRLEYDAHNKKLMSYEIIPYMQTVEMGGTRQAYGKEKEDIMKKMFEYNNLLGDKLLYLKA